MRLYERILVCAVLLQTSGCSDSEFSGSTKTGDPAPDQKTNGEVVSKPTQQDKSVPESKQVRTPSRPQASPTAAPGPLTEACSTTGALALEASVPTHRDLDAQATNRYGASMPSSDVAESQVVRLNLNNVKGDVLPVTSFALDDIAIIVKENQNLAAASTWDPGARLRTIRVPADALLVYDGNDPEYASGAVDSGATTVYEFTDKRITIAGGTSQSLRSVYELGIPLIAHNKVLLSELKERGFIDASNHVVLKVFHVAHGWGNVKLRFDLKACP